jgi:hypothetical protein
MIKKKARSAGTTHLASCHIASFINSWQNISCLDQKTAKGFVA